MGFNSFFSKIKNIFQLKYILLGVIVLILAFIIPFVYEIWGIYKNTKSAQSNLERGLQSILINNLDQADQEIQNAQENLISAQNAFLPLTHIGYIKNFDVLENSTIVVTELFEVAVESAEITKKVNNLLQSVQKESLNITKNIKNDVSTHQDKNIEKFNTLNDELREIRNQFLLIELKAQQIDANNIYKSLVDKVDLLQQQLQDSHNKVNESFEIVHAVPHLLGIYEPKKFLVLLLNHTELRPGGGFIGTYGEVEFSQGRVTSIFTDDSYNIDNNAIETFNAEPPIQLTQYLNSEKWYFRDSNWSPDFYRSTQKGLELIEQETGKSNDYNAVIGVNPFAVGRIIDYFGGVAYDGVHYTSENLVEVLEYKVEREFHEVGTPVENRKDVINHLTQEIIKKVRNLPFNKILDLALILKTSLDQKEIMLYHEDDFVQHLLEQNNYAGRINQTSNDFLMVADANLASLKTDEVMNKHISYTLDSLINDFAEVTVKLRYENTGNFDWKTTRYNSYTRMLIPKNAKVIRKSENISLSTTEIENKKSLGFYWTTEPQKTNEIYISYQIPRNLNENNKKSYQLYLQKQSGNVSTFSIDVKNPDMIQSVQHYQDQLELGVQYNLEKDAQITFNF